MPFRTQQGVNSRFSAAFSCHIGILPSVRSRSRNRCTFRAAAEEATSTSGKESGVNITKYKSQRSIISADKSEITAEEVNSLMVKAGKRSRDLNKWDKALQGSYAVVSARLISDSRLVGFARATSDRALNGTIWDVVTDPSLPDELLMKRNVVKYLLRELRRTVPGCSIALFSSDLDMSFFESLEFVADPDGIKGMAMIDNPDQAYL